jgi:hypothetical protein
MCTSDSQPSCGKANCSGFVSSAGAATSCQSLKAISAHAVLSWIDTMPGARMRTNACIMIYILRSHRLTLRMRRGYNSFGLSVLGQPGIAAREYFVKSPTFHVLWPACLVYFQPLRFSLLLE